MNDKNYEFLDKQIKFTGFGEGHSAELKEKMEKQTPEFTIFHQQDFGKDSSVATLQFRKSNESDMYFFNRFNLLLKNEKLSEPIRQTFYINSNQENITLLQGYNLLSGRAVHKELTTKQGEKYMAWLQLDFKLTDKNGNYETKKYHQNYGFDLEKSLAAHPIKELATETDKKRLLESLQRGNRQGATLIEQGKEQKIFIEASPQFKSLNFYDTQMKRVHSVAMQQSSPQAQSAEHTKKQSTDIGSSDDTDTAKSQSVKNNRRKKMKLD